MGLDAYVYCDCFEQNRLHSAPNQQWQVSVADDGSRITESDELEDQLAFDQWNTSACDHEDGIRMSERIGNISLVATLRTLLEAEAHPLPVLLENVLYRGSHCGDWLTIQQVKALEQELNIASLIRCPDPVEDPYLQNFIQTLQRLLSCSLKLHKPIAF